MSDSVIRVLGTLAGVTVVIVASVLIVVLATAG